MAWQTVLGVGRRARLKVDPLQINRDPALKIADIAGVHKPAS